MAYTRNKNMVNVLNYAIKNNRMNNLDADRVSDLEGLVLAEDLSNLVDVGTKIASLDADQLKSFAKDVAMGIAKIEFIDRVYTADTHGIVKTDVEYSGALERICTKALAQILPSNANKLVNGVNYLDGKYYGPELDAVVWTDENANFKVPYSLGYETIKAKFTDEKWVTTTFASWENMVHSTIEIHLKGLADTLINKMIVDTVSGGRVVNLVSGFGDYFGYYTDSTSEGVTTRTYTYDYTDIIASETLSKQFVAYFGLICSIIRDGFTKMQSKYNDGSVPTFTPSDKIRFLGLTQFVNNTNFLGRMNLFNDGVIPKENISTVLSWQSDGEELLPILSNTSNIKYGSITMGTGASAGKVASQNATDVNGIVGIMYDEDMLGVTCSLNKIGVEEVGAELFNTYFHHFAIRQYLDKRGNAVAFKLDTVTKTS